MLACFGFNFAPRGWALCNGQILAISQNAALFSLLGTTYGGNGTTTFALPNLQSRWPLHFGQGSGLSNYVLGQVGGVENVSLNISNIPAHTHTVAPLANSAQGNNAHPGGNFPASAGSQIYNTANDNTAMGASNTGPAGSSIPFSALPPYLALNWCIALEGIFPSRN
jgi:microcystin-dependent protein